MRKILRPLKNIRVLNLIRRLYFASTYYNKRYWQILKWGFTSREDANFTYQLTPGNMNYLAHTISIVTKVEYAVISRYLEEIQSDEIVRKTIETAIERSPFRKFADKEISFGRRVGWYAFARAIKPKIIIETGVDKGLGSIVLCAALLRNREEGFPGNYFGTDINPDAGFILSDKYKTVGEILYGDSIESLKTFSEKIDLFINDSDHSADYEYREYVTIEMLLSDKAIILGDNSHCSSKLSDFSIEKNRNFLFFHEVPLNHWYPGAGIGISFRGDH